MPLRFLFLVLALLVAGGLPAPAHAARQSSGQGAGHNFSIDGQVLFPNDRSAASILVELHSINGGVVDQSTTDSVGRFFFPGLTSGDYEIIINASGFRTVRLPVPLDGASANGLVIELNPVTSATGNSPASGGEPTISVDDLRIPEKACKEYEEGARSFDAGKTGDAASHLEKAIKMYPNFGESYMMLAAAYADQGRFSQADAAIQKALSRDPNDSRAYSYFGIVLIREKNFPRAEEAFQKSIALQDTNWFAHLEYARLLINEKKFADAYPHLVSAHENLSQLPLVHLLLYNDLIALDRKQQGLAELDDFLTRFPGDPRAAQVRQMRQALGQSLAQQNH